MVSGATLLDNLFALALVVAWALAAGLPLAALLRIPLGWGAALLLGLAYWSAALYLLPFAHGHDAAGVLALGLLAWTWRRRPISWKMFQAWLTDPAWWILVVGCSAYATLLVTQYVAPGMDASMHSTAVRLIGEHHGLPRTYAPFASGLRFPTVNLGLPSLAAAAVRCGSSATSAMLGAEVLTYAGFILANFVLLRLWTTRTTAALLGVFAAWASRSAQDTVGWGGFPTVGSLALGILGARLAIDLVRRPAWRSALPLGLTVAAIPLVHGVGAAVWFYTVAPLSAVVAWRSAPRLWPALKISAAAGVVAGVVLAAYVALGHFAVSPFARDWIRNASAEQGPKGEGWQFVLATLNYVRTFSGSGVMALALVSTVYLLWRRRWHAVAALVVGFVLVVLAVANVRFYLLPMSMLLYPERVVYVGATLAVIALALAWQALPGAWRARGSVRLLASTLLLIMGAQKLNHHFESVARQPAVTESQWHALNWCAKNLRPERDYVLASYNQVAAYLPPVAGILTNGWHLHVFMTESGEEYLRTRQPTHRLINLAKDERGDFTPDQVVFQNEEVIVLKLAH